jgi:CHAD domain-containing protein
MASEQAPRSAHPHAAPHESDSKPARRKSGGKLRLPRRRPLRAGVVAAFGRVLAAARRFARASAEDSASSVHEYRKSIRRARAVVALLRPALGPRAERGLRRRLREAFEVTGAFRDADVLQTTLSALPPVPEDDLARHAIAVSFELDQRRSRRDASEALARGLASVAALPAVLDVCLDPAFSAHDLERGLLRLRRRERRALEQARKSRGVQDFHEWRKRLKELRYAIELVASSGARELQEREKKLGNLARDLGSVTDLTVLAREIERRRDEGAIPAAPHLLATIGGLAAGRSAELLDRGSELFARQVLAERG